MYNIREVETIASKKTGICPMQIKDVLRNLVDEGLVNCEKCGTCNIYWSFQYTLVKKIKQEHERMMERKEQLQDIIRNYQCELEILQRDRLLKDAERDNLLRQLSELSSVNSLLVSKLASTMANNPIQLTSRERHIQEVQEAVDMMVDNIEILISFIYEWNPCGLSKSEIRKYFRVPEDL